MNKVEKIKAEIERRKEIHFKDYHINKNGNSADYGACNALTQLLSFIDSLEEEPVSNDLEEFAKRESELFGEREYEIDFIDRNALAKGYYWGVKAGAQWQKEQDQSTIELAEDHAMLAGMEKMRQEMMKDAVEAQYQGFQLFLGQTFVLWNYKELPFEAGDKVKLIIIMEE